MKANVKKNKTLIIFSVVYYVLFGGLMILGTFKDLDIAKAVFDPQNSFAKLAESFGQFVYWGMWGPALSVIILSRHDFSELFDFCKKHSRSKIEVKIKNQKTFNVINKVVTAFYYIVFYVLAVVGWKKLIQNVTKNVLINMDKPNLSEAVYFIISAAAALAVLLAFCRIGKEKFRKIEGAAFIGIFIGILLKCVEEMKPLTQRVRFREMVAYSHGYLNDKGMSEGKYSPLESSMASSSDFSAFAPWYKKGDAMGIYSRSDSFPSGHTSYSCTLFLSYVLFGISEKLKKSAPFMLMISAVYVAVMGYSRMAAGAHYLTDVAAAALIGYTVFLFVRAVYLFLAEKDIVPSL